MRVLNLLQITVILRKRNRGPTFPYFKASINSVITVTNIEFSSGHSSENFTAGINAALTLMDLGGNAI